MSELVGTWYDEWEVAIKDPVKRTLFKQFKNTEERSEQIELIRERDQTRPANWPKQSALEDFRGYKWTSLEWEKVCKADDLRHSAASGLRYQTPRYSIGYFLRTSKGRDTMQLNKCVLIVEHSFSPMVLSATCWRPANRSPLARCINVIIFLPRVKIRVGENASLTKVSVSQRSLSKPVGIDEVWVKLRPEEELDSCLLGTTKWRIKKGETPAKLGSLDKYTAKMKIRFRNTAHDGEVKLDW
jgi:nitrite reductase (NAD(P)H)